MGSDYGSGTFENQPVLGMDVLVKYTYYGDANLDGSDYSRIDSGFIAHGTGWSNGDFNYDNVINGFDYTLIDNLFNTQGAVITSSIADAQIAAVPETTFATVLMFVASAGLRRRRQFRSIRSAITPRVVGESI